MSFKGIGNSVKNVYGWTAENGSARLKMDLPNFVKKRIEYFREEPESGLSFLGYMNAVLGYDEHEKENKDNFDMFGTAEWLPASDEFKSWRDEYFSMRQLEVAVAIIYGAYEWDKLEEAE